MVFDRHHANRLFSLVLAGQSAKRKTLVTTHHYNHERPNQALDRKTPAEEVENYTMPYREKFITIQCPSIFTMGQGQERSTENIPLGVLRPKY
jgi:hypothetical protein